MNELDALKGFIIFFIIISIGFLLLYIFDTFVYEALFSVDMIRSGIDNNLYWLMSAAVSFGLPVALLGRAFREALGV